MNESAVYKKLKDELNKVPKIKVIITTEDFAGNDVTLSLNGAVYVKRGTFDSNGKCEFYVEHVGAYTITCGEKTKSVDVAEVGGIYQAEINDSVIYGFHIDGTESSPSGNITYLEAAVGMTPASMNFSTGVFNYGDWADAFFMPRPCMLKNDGTVDYYLNPNDYTKKADGTASDVANTSYAGNAMMEWGKDGCQIWYKIVPDGSNGADVYISDAQQDENYHAYSFIGVDGNLKEHFYTPIYNGCVVSSKLRSISGQSIMNNVAGGTEISYATANGTGYYIETFADRILINLLLMLIGKNTNTQATFGNGHHTGGSAAGNLLKSGTMNDKGLFYGTNGTGVGVKVFGMENYWGNQWRRTAGLLNVSGTQKYKLTAPYNDSGSDYNTVSGGTPDGTSGGYVNKMIYTSDGAMITKTASGSDSTFYADGMWFNNSQTDYALFGGICSAGLRCGAFACHLNTALSVAAWDIGAALSYHG